MVSFLRNSFNMIKPIFVLATLIISTEAITQDNPPLREPFFISSKIKFRQRDLSQDTQFIEKFNDKYGDIELKYNLNRMLYGTIVSKEQELFTKQKKSKQERTFLKISSCLKRVLDISPRGPNQETFKVDDCYSIYNVKPVLFFQTFSGEKLTNKEKLLSDGDELSKLLGSIEDNFVDKSIIPKFEEYLEAKNRKIKIENGGLDELKAKISQLEEELMRRKKFDELVEKKLMSCKSEMTLPFKEFKEVKPSNDFAYEAANDLLMSVANDYKITNHTYYSINEDNVGDIFTQLTFKGYCTDKSIEDVSTNCKEEKSDLEKISTIFETCTKREESIEYLSGMSSLTDIFNMGTDPNKKKQDLENLRRVVVSNLYQGISVTANMDQKNHSIIGIKEVNGVCKYQIRDFSKKETYWLKESEVLDRLKEIKYLVRYTRPQD